MNFKEFRENEGRKYLPIVAVAFGLFVLCILFFFLVFRFEAVRMGIGAVLGILAPFFYGAVFAYLLRPMCKYFERNFKIRLNRRFPGRSWAGGAANILSVTVSMILVLAAVFVLASLTLQSVFNSIVGLVNSLPDQLNELTVWLEGVFAGNDVALNYIHSLSGSVNDGLNSFFSDQLLPNLENVIGGVSAGAMTIVTQFINLFIGLIVAVYLLASRSRWRAQLKMLVHCLFKGKGYDMVVSELRFIDRTFTDYISGRILDSVIVGVIMYIFCTILGVQDAALVAVVNGITNIIPYFGPFIGAIPSALLIFIDDPVKCVWFILFVLVLQQIDGNIICPKILSSAVGLSSFWVLFSTLLFGGLFGFVGMLVGVPIFVVIYDLLKKLIYLVLRKRGDEALIEEYEGIYHKEKPKKKKKRVSARSGQDTP